MHALDRIVDSLHAVGHVVHLASAAHLQTNGGTHYVGVVLAHMHDHRASSRRRRGDKAHVAHARDSHLHGTRNRRCRKREDIDLLAQVLELFLMLHAKALLLVDDHQPQIVGVHIGGKQAVRSDEHIDLSFGKSRKRALLLPRRPKARKHIHLHAKGGKALKERLEMLLRQNGRGAQHHHLAPRIHALEGSTQGNFGLAKTHIATEQAVHGLCRLHVCLDIGDGVELIMRLLVRKALLHLDLLGRIGRARNAGNGGAARIKIHQIECKLLGAFACLARSAAPVSGVQARQARLVAVGANIARDAVHLLKRHVEFVAISVFKQEIIALATSHLLADNLSKQGNTMRGMDHVIARLEGERDLGDIHATTRASAFGIHASIQIGDGKDSQMRIGNHASLLNGRIHKGHATARERGDRVGGAFFKTAGVQ